MYQNEMTSSMLQQRICQSSQTHQHDKYNSISYAFIVHDEALLQDLKRLISFDCSKRL